MSSQTTIGPALRAELHHEGPLTRLIIAAIPNDKLDYKPHPKNWTARQLIGHLVEIPGWTKPTLDYPEWDMAAEEYKVPEFPTVEEALAEYDKNLATALEALATISEEAIQQPWTMRAGPKVFFTMPKMIVIRNFILNHTIHHRAQLMMYLRLLEIPVPAIYGNSADDPGAFA